MSQRFRHGLRNPYLALIGLAAIVFFSSRALLAEDSIDAMWGSRLERMLNAERSAEGSPSFERRVALDDLAREIATSLSKKPPKKRLTLSRSLESWLEKSDIPFRRAYHFTYLSKGTNDPVQDLVDRWKKQGRRWRKVMDSKMRAMGFGAARSEDDWLILVAVVLRDPAEGKSAGIAKATQRELWMLEREVHERINKIRLEYGFSHLSWDDEVSRIARNHSTDMAVRGYFAHEDPQGRGLEDRLTGLAIEKAAENIAASKNYEQPLEIAVRNWLDSPSHRANMLDEDFTRTGVGLAVDRDGKYFFTQIFVRIAGDY